MNKSEDLVDIRDVMVDVNLPYKERLESYLLQIKNPNKFKYGNIKVECSYSKDGITMEELLRDLILNS